jgi:hypothetical protein
VRNEQPAPRPRTPNFDQRVTQGMSPDQSVWASASNASQPSTYG